MTNELNPLSAFFDRHSGRGIWKWRHYFDIYHRHFARFRGTSVHVLEIGIYSGGSLDMWRDYFGLRATIYGVDIEPACKAYEASGVKVFIGDQADRTFWSTVRAQAPQIDIVIDDGGHEPNQQVTSLQELFPHLRPGGIYVCEDVHGIGNDFATYTHKLAHNLNGTEGLVDNMNDNERRLVCPANPTQASIMAIHLYPYVTVIEKVAQPIQEFRAPKHGTTWEPFLT